MGVFQRKKNWQSRSLYPTRMLSHNACFVQFVHLGTPMERHLVVATETEVPTASKQAVRTLLECFLVQCTFSIGIRFLISLTLTWQLKYIPLNWSYLSGVEQHSNLAFVTILTCEHYQRNVGGKFLPEKNDDRKLYNISLMNLNTRKPSFVRIGAWSGCDLSNE